jgi:succinate dehydrogenase / fumarate reductase cytochrome b subunit
MNQKYDRGQIEDLGRWTEFSAGMWAWILHKFSGWILIGYLFTHIPVLSGALIGPEAYTTTLQGLESLFIIRVMEVGLLSVAVFHILNGTRLLMVDLGIGLDAQETSFYAALILTGFITVASVPTFMQGVF